MHYTSLSDSFLCVKVKIGKVRNFVCQPILLTTGQPDAAMEIFLCLITVEKSVSKEVNTDNNS